MDWEQVVLERDRITVDPHQVITLLGSPKKAEETHSRSLIMKYLKECREIMAPCGGFGRYSLIVHGDKMILEINEIPFHTGRIVTGTMRKAETCVLFLATLGPEPEYRARALLEQGALLEGYILDLIASSLVEVVAGLVAERIAQVASEEGLITTNRYSPGYCSWDVQEQQKLFTLVGNRCGIRLSESSMMTPIKSISGLIGLGTQVKFSEYLCSDCPMGNCIYRRA